MFRKRHLTQCSAGKPLFLRGLCLFGVLIALLPCVLVGTVNAQSLQVSAPSASLLDQPSKNANVLARLTRGEPLKPTGNQQGEWIELEAPTVVSGWIHSELVRDGVVTPLRLRVRSGPGVGYAILGTLERDDKVVVRGREGDWVEVQGQPSFRVWVDRAMVGEPPARDLTATARTSEPSAVSRTTPPPARPEVTVRETPPPPARDPVRPAPSPVVSRTPPPPVAPVRREPAPPVRREPAPVVMPEPVLPDGASPVGRRLIASAPQGEVVTISGVVRPVGLTFFPGGNFRLVEMRQRGSARTLCFLVGSPARLSSRIGETVSIQGRRYWAHGSREPIVLVYAIR